MKEFSKGESVKISDNVYNYSVIKDGKVLYMYDYSTKYYAGDLYLWNNKESKLIDDDVTCILPVNFDYELQKDWLLDSIYSKDVASKISKYYSNKSA